MRFKDIRSLVERIMYNKSKREQEEEVVYSRFVLSSVRVKTLHPSQEETVKKGKKKKMKEVVPKKEEEGKEEGEKGEGEETPQGGKEMGRYEIYFSFVLYKIEIIFAGLPNEKVTTKQQIWTRTRAKKRKLKSWRTVRGGSREGRP